MCLTPRRSRAETEVAFGVESNGTFAAAPQVLTDDAYHANVFDVLRTAKRF